MRDGAPDYTAETIAERYDDFLRLKARLEAVDTTGWPISEQVDWHLVRGLGSLYAGDA